MSDLLSADTDYEAAKYDEAATIMDAGFNAEAIKSKKSVFNPEQGVNEILMPMQSGGYVQIGQQSLEVEASLPGAVLIDGIEYGPETAEYQRYYPKKDPSPAAMTEAPAMPAAPEAQADVDIDMGAQVRGVQDYAAQLRDIQGGFSEEDLTAAGYSPQVIQQAGLGVSQVEPIAPLSQEEIQQQLQQGTLSVFTSDPTLRESGSQALTATLTDIALNSLREDLEAEYVSQTGEAIPERGSAEYPRSIQETLRTRENELMGEAEVLSNAVFGHKSGIGVADFATAGIMDIQEGARLFSQGRAENKDSKVDRLLGALLVAAGIAEATGVGMFVGKAIKKSLPSIRSAIEVVGERLNQPGPMPTTSSFGAGAIDDSVLNLMDKLVSPEEKQIVVSALPDEELSTTAQAQIANQKNNYASDQGWLQEGMEVASVKQKKDKIEVTYKEVPYNFHIPPEGTDTTKWEKTITDKTVKEIEALARRAAKGDLAAKAIINEANWYRSMRARMRAEFGGLGDVYADLLGTTSAQTGVTQNWDNAIEIMRRFTRGEFDQEIAMYEDMLARGEANPIKLGQLHKDPNSPFKLITKASGSLFNANSPASTRALLDMFRNAQGSPKTPNFTGNLIGYTNAATVDVWAARFLRRMSGQKRLPPPVEKGVAGQHLAGSTLQDPKVGSEFGFGQRVIQSAVDKINNSGVIKSVAPEIGDMGADDLQAVLWFLEKEIWTNKGWTSKAGEGGSLDFEASLAGAADQPRVKQLREIINKKFTPPKPLKQKADESDADYAERMAVRRQTATEANQLAKQEAQQELDASFAPLARYVLGISVERPGARPTNVQQAETSARISEPAKEDPSVVMYQVNNTYGRFMQEDERAFNAEFVVRENFDPSKIKSRMAEVAKDADQDAAFISKVVPQRTENSRPGVEIYFQTRQPADFARNLSDKLTEYGVDGFTFVTDARVADMPARQAGLEEEAIAGVTGLRFQYIPEFDMGADAWNAMSASEKAAKIDEMEDMFDDIVVDITSQNPDVSTALVMHYETDVIERGSYDSFITKKAE